MTKKERVQIILDQLEALFPVVKPALNYSNHWQLLVAVVLSAQCTDKQVNKVTAVLFDRHPNLEDYLKLNQAQMEEEIKAIGLFRGKAKNILAAAKMLIEEYAGVLPKTVKELMKLPGVGRKTANVVLTEAYGIAEGIAVDTHVKRLANKFGLTTHKDPKKIEEDLMKIIPKDAWSTFTLRMIEYGRKYSPARKVALEDDPISRVLATR